MPVAGHEETPLRGVGGYEAAEWRSSADKALLVLEALSAEGGVAQLGVLAARTRLSKPTTHRLLAVLMNHRIVERSGSDYVLGARLLALATQAPSTIAADLVLLQQIAMARLVDLHEHTRSTVFLGVLNDPDVRYLAKIHGSGAARTPSLVLDSAPAWRTAIGKVLLAFASDSAASSPDTVGRPKGAVARVPRAELGAIRGSGLAHNNGDYSPRVVCVATAIFASGDQPLAGIAVAGDVTGLDIVLAGRQLRRTAWSISAELRTATRIGLRVPSTAGETKLDRRERGSASPVPVGGRSVRGSGER
ncbi:IclR family transcriptional regulator [Nocardia terpenica]|uniref:Helix-turn-helix domain-containing protein n=1 Tax=Nocardia terpenica TaxID=455432 RepID=A0A6G9ZD74_9NOCA|nr:helix-turn-helix domain-containing protein [Nocardia terpenica]QIS23565.1 helix-turn-helix domain-containing protein [Nocardia terpenica]